VPRATASATRALPPFQGPAKTGPQRGGAQPAVLQELRAFTWNGHATRKQITSVGPSAIQYNSAKPADILAEDKIVGVWELGLRPQDVEIVPVANVFE